MDFLSNISLILNYTTFGLILGSTIVGVLIGALPGLSSGMAIALLLPFLLPPPHCSGPTLGGVSLCLELPGFN